MKRNNLQKVVCLSTISLTLGGCTSYWESKKAHSLIEQGNVTGVNSLHWHRRSLKSSDMII